VDHGPVALLGGQRAQQREGQVLLLRQRPEHADAGRLGADHHRRRGDALLLVDREVQRDVMADEPPAPQRVGLRLAEERQEVAAGVAEVARDVAHPRLVDLAQQVLEVHGGEDPRVALDGHPLADQAVHEDPLLVRQVAQRHAAPPRLGQGIPVRALVLVGERDDDPPSIAVVERVVERHRGERHQRRADELVVHGGPTGQGIR
jgi:hypothetical protein